MKLSIIITAGLVAVAFITGYFAGSFKVGTIGGSNTEVNTNMNVTLNVLILGPDGLPINNLEVDLWHDTTTTGPPDAGINFTNASGIAVFSLQKGGYLIGFNLINFPSSLEVPRETPISIINEFNNVTINVYNKTQ